MMCSTAVVKQIDAISYAALAHDGQRYGGLPYMYHLLEVLKVYVQLFEHDEVLAQVCILHDILEDTNRTKDDIAKRFGFDVMHGVENMTRRKKNGNTIEEYDVYIQ